ncbi:MAG: phosphotransferase family protein [Thermomicrobiales bacterium]
MKSAELQRIAAGREAEIFAWEDGKVLRLFRNPNAGEAVRREAAAMTAVRQVVPLVPLVSEVVEVDGRPGLILERIDGPDLLSRFKERPWTLWEAGRLTGRVHAELNRLPGPESLPDVKQQIERKLSRLPAVPAAIAERARALLQDLPDGDRLLHGDMHLANVILTDAGPIVIDWPNAARGEPTADLARTMAIGRANRAPEGTPRLRLAVEMAGRKLVFRAHERAYRRGLPVDAALLDRWLVVRAAERLAEAIPEERAWLLHFVQTSLGVDTGEF